VRFTRIAADQSFYRAHTPRWASQPLSGAGAAKVGGRLNRPGVHALYLSDSPELAIAEYQQDAVLLPPCTLTAYRLDLGRVVDHRHGYEPAHWSPLWQDLGCNWRGMAFLDRIEPPTWVLADQVLAAGACGVLYPTQRADAHGLNLVVYLDALTSTDRIAVHDPDDRLPRNLASWES
jgi:RES domain-containing protein